MDYSTDPNAGQHEVITLSSHLCYIMELLRAWWAHFEQVIRQLDRAAAVKGHDLMIEGVMTARELARITGIQLPDTSQVSWTVAPRPIRPAFDM